MYVGPWVRSPTWAIDSSSCLDCYALFSFRCLFGSRWRWLPYSCIHSCYQCSLPSLPLSVRLCATEHVGIFVNWQLDCSRLPVCIYYKLLMPLIVSLFWSAFSVHQLEDCGGHVRFQPVKILWQRNDLRNANGAKDGMGLIMSGGFFASGFKRAFKIKDFGDSIPGHGGLTDRMDCQVKFPAQCGYCCSVQSTML